MPPEEYVASFFASHGRSNTVVVSLRQDRPLPVMACGGHGTQDDNGRTYSETVVVDQFHQIDRSRPFRMLLGFVSCPQTYCRDWRDPSTPGAKN